MPIFIGRGAPFGYSEGLAGACSFKRDSCSHAASRWISKYVSRATRMSPSAPRPAAIGIHPAKIMPMPSTARMAPSQADNGDGSPLVIQIMGSITTGAIEPRMAAVPAS